LVLYREGTLCFNRYQIFFFQIRTKTSGSEFRRKGGYQISVLGMLIELKRGQMIGRKL